VCTSGLPVHSLMLTATLDFNVSPAFDLTCQIPLPMPELAEVSFYARQWEAGLGREVREVVTHPVARIYRDCPAATVTKELRGRHLDSWQTHGKQMLFGFGQGRWLSLHLGMSGELRTDPVTDAAPDKHAHLVLVMDEIRLVFSDPRMFGRVTVDVTSDGGLPLWWRELPPAIHQDAFDAKLLGDFLERHPRTPLKTLLLDQRCFPGIGNWMADEICWQLRMAPAIPTGELSQKQIGALHKMIRRIASEALHIIGTDWSDPPKSWLFLHRWRDGGLCPRRGCGTPLLRAELRGRTTCWCPRCQL